MFRRRRAARHFPMSPRKWPRSSSDCWMLGLFSLGKRILISLPPDWLASARPTALAIRFSIPTIFPEDRVRVQRLRLLPDWSRLHSELIQLVPGGYRRHSIELLWSNHEPGC